MGIKIFYAILTGLFFMGTANAQDYGDGDRYKVGLKGGPVLSTLKGNALASSTAKFGFTGGVYFRYKLKNGFHFQTEINPCIRGAKFKANDPKDYNEINMLYIDAVELIMKDLKKGSHTHCVLFGLQPSVLIQSWVYTEYYQFRAAATDIALNRGDLYAVVGYKLNKRLIGIQTSLKIGLTNINRGLNIYDFAGLPLGPTNNKGMVRNISWETTLAF